jgi:hypothetical protein
MHSRSRIHCSRVLGRAGLGRSGARLPGAPDSGLGTDFLMPPTIHSRRDAALMPVKDGAACGLRRAG